MTAWTAPVSSTAYPDGRAARHREWERAGQQAHAFAPDGITTWLYCERCGCERGAIQHTS